MKSIHKIIIALLCAAAVAGCKKSFLDRPSNSQISANKFYKTTSDLRLATAGLYGGAMWWQWNNGGYIQLASNIQYEKLCKSGWNTISKIRRNYSSGKRYRQSLLDYQ